MADTLDVGVGQDRRAALLQRLTSQAMANTAGTQSFDRLNAGAAHGLGLPRPVGMAAAHAMMPTPAPGPNRAYSGLPTGGTSPYAPVLPVPPQVARTPTTATPAFLQGGNATDLIRTLLAAQKLGLTTQGV